jgi:3-phosphoshikimate 1-carboxyvinyltransferase
MTTPWTFRGQGPLRGLAALPGDKSVSHRAFLLNALGKGEVRITGLNPGADVRSTADALRALGVRIQFRGPESATLQGRSGRLRPATDAIDCGNSGTTMRVLSGLLAAQAFTVTLDGDASLRGRPMTRIADPLRRMGARVEGPSGGQRPPLVITGGSLTGGRFELPVASAQVKSCILVGAAASGNQVEVISPGPSRDHTERMLSAMGAAIEWTDRTARLGPTRDLECVDVAVPADPSAAALVCAAVAAVPGSRVRFEHVMLNPTRTGFLSVLERMGVRVERQGGADAAGEPVGSIDVIAPGSLQSTVVTPDEVPTLIDEIPALAVVAAFAAGSTRFQSVSELRVKESDRVGSTQDLLRSFGIGSETPGDDLVIHGGTPEPPPEVAGSEDHRIAMAACSLARATVARADAPGRACTVRDIRSAAVSFPDFASTLERLTR